MSPNAWRWSLGLPFLLFLFSCWIFILSRSHYFTMPHEKGSLPISSFLSSQHCFLLATSSRAFLILLNSSQKSLFLLGNEDQSMEELVEMLSERNVLFYLYFFLSFALSWISSPFLPCWPTSWYGMIHCIMIFSTLGVSGTPQLLRFYCQFIHELPSHSSLVQDLDYCPWGWPQANGQIWADDQFWLAPDFLPLHRICWG